MTHPDDKKPDLPKDTSGDEPPTMDRALTEESATTEEKPDTGADSTPKKEETRDAKPKNTPPPPPKRPKSAAPSRRRPWIWPLISLCLLALVVVGGYWGYQQWQALNQGWQQLSSSQQQLSRQVDTLQTQLNQSQQARTALQERMQAELAAQENLLVDTAQRLSRRQDLEADRWPLEEALALLRLAERRLQLDQNATVALQLLNAADQVLADLTNAAVLPVRKQIAQDRLALQSVDYPDTNGLYFRLEAVDDALAALDWTPEDRVKPEPQPETGTPWQAFVDSLSSLVTVTRLDTPYEAPPLLDDFSRWQQHGRLLTEQVQLALLAGNQPLFDAALEQLIQHLQPMQETLKLNASLTELREIQGAQLNPDWPDIHSSVRALEDYMARAETSSPNTEESTTETQGEDAE